MDRPRDPIERAVVGQVDLYEVTEWEQRSGLDRFAMRTHWVIARSVRLIVTLAAVFVLVGIGGVAVLTDPQTSMLTVLSGVPAVAIAWYVYRSDVTTAEPLSLLVATVLLGMVTASFAAVINTAVRPSFSLLGPLGVAAFFIIVVGPVEEAVKLLAVRLYAYSDVRFDAVIDGAVYGAMAGLGFAIVENAFYITNSLPMTDIPVGAGLIGAGGGITAVRALAGPGHVIYSAIAGYYLGLAKFNPGMRGPIIIKGLLIAAGVHALYNLTVGPATLALGAVVGGRTTGLIAYVVVFDGALAMVLLGKLRRYEAVYRRVVLSGGRR
jgi:RsiW-degrading membrane proteinase PrsW (M82 family)